MNEKRAKWIRKLIDTKNPVLFTLIRNKYGEKTNTMNERNVYKAAKKLWKTGELQEVTGWPSCNELRENLKKVK